ncbi:MAG: hypothetical protein IJT66_06645, partial [Clostridia bacterium]|nr:hypothetical protein [Clostridia bacterium]
MNKGKKWLILLLCGAMALGTLAGCSSENKEESTAAGNAEATQTTASKDSWEGTGNGLGASPVVFKHIGNIEDANFHSYDIVSRNEQKEITMRDPLGVDRLKKVFSEYEFVQKAKGLAIVRTFDTAPNNMGLVNINTGKVYIPYNAAIIKQLNERFFAVYYATGKTTDKTKACLSYNKEYGHSVASAYDGDEKYDLYEGNGKVYDLTVEDFVAGIQVTSADDSIRGVGEYFSVCNNAEKKLVLYNTDCEPVKGFPEYKYYYTFNEYNIFRADGVSSVYDKDANFLFSTKDDVAQVFKGEYYSCLEDDGYYTMHRKDGTLLFDTKSDTRFKMYGTIFSYTVKTDDDDYLYGLISETGDEIMPANIDFVEENKPAT